MPRIAASNFGGPDLPILTLDLELPQGLLQGVVALVDSGADSTIVNVESLAPAGIGWGDISGDEQTGAGAGGGFATKRLKATVRWQQWIVCDEVAVAAPGALPWALLGRDDFFRKFVVRFAWHRMPPEMHIDPVTMGSGPKPRRRRK